MIDFKKMRTEETTYVLVPRWHKTDLEFALKLSEEQGWEFRRRNIPEEIRSKFSEEELRDGIFLISHFDAAALYAVIPGIGYDMDIQAAQEEQDYQEMREEWDAHRGKNGDYEGISEGEFVPWADMDYSGGNDDTLINFTLDEDDLFDEDLYEGSSCEEETEEEDCDDESLQNEEAENMTEEEVLEYDRKRGGRRYVDESTADYLSEKCAKEDANMLIEEHAEVIMDWLINEHAERGIQLMHRERDGSDSPDQIARHGDSVLCRYTNCVPVICLQKDETLDIGFNISSVYLYIVEYMREFSAQDENAPVRKYYSATPEEIEKKEEELKEFSKIIENTNFFE